jgi:Cu/Ag efflux protein CusF
MKFKTQWAIGISLWLPGCASYVPEALTPNHPAHAEAMGAPGRPASTTLAYTKADMPSPRPVRPASMDMKMDMTKDGHGTGAAATSAPQTVVADGSVVAVVPSSGQIVLEHGVIKDFMDAMTMGYRVESADLLEGLKQGDKVRFTIDIDKKSIIKLEKRNQ